MTTALKGRPVFSEILFADGNELGRKFHSDDLLKGILRRQEEHFPHSTTHIDEPVEGESSANQIDESRKQGLERAF